jgi:DnaD/phage-associated family protein
MADGRVFALKGLDGKMTTKRLISCDIWEDEFFTSLATFERLLWIGLITGAADDQGRLQDKPVLIRSKVFPLDDIPAKQIEDALNTFVQAGKIVRYIADGYKAIQIVNWWKHQIPQWAGRSKIKSPEGWTDRIRYHGKGNEIINENWDKPGGYIADYIAEYAIREVKVKGKGEGEVKDEGEEEDKPSSGGVFKAYEANIGLITKAVSDEIGVALQDTPPEWLIESFQEAAKQNKRSWAYAKGILKRWHAQGKDSGARPKETAKFIGPDGNVLED